ncbi:MAG: hypothetical protein CMI29_04875 [Opitutae bacterium]|nr:hypothetical protein [Opitutae bacterium]
MKHKGKKSNRRLEFGGLSFQPDFTPFASATGKDEMPMDDDLISEPPWWLVAAGGLIGKLKIYKKCNCVNEDGSITQLDDCPRTQNCTKCCQGREGENFIGGYDPMMASQKRG